MEAATAQATAEKPWILASLIVCMMAFTAYLVYMFIDNMGSGDEGNSEKVCLSSKICCPMLCYSTAFCFAGGVRLRRWRASIRRAECKEGGCRCARAHPDSRACNGLSQGETDIADMKLRRLQGKALDNGLVTIGTLFHHSFDDLEQRESSEKPLLEGSPPLARARSCSRMVQPRAAARSLGAVALPPQHSALLARCPAAGVAAFPAVAGGLNARFIFLCAARLSHGPGDAAKLGKMKAFLGQKFNQYDTDHNGTLDSEELQELFKDLFQVSFY